MIGRGFTNIAADTNADGRVEVFGVGLNGAFSHMWQATPGGAWSPWTPIVGGLTSVAVARNYDGRLQLFGTIASGVVYTKTQTVAGGEWSPWTRLTGRLDNVAAEMGADGRIEVFGVTTNGVVYRARKPVPAPGCRRGRRSTARSARNRTERETYDDVGSTYDAQLEKIGVCLLGRRVLARPTGR